MAKSQQSYNKKEKEKKRLKKKKEKAERREHRKQEKLERGPKSFEDMLAYVDENGNLTTEKPDPTKKKVYKLEDIQLGVPAREKVEFDPIREGKVKFFNHEKGYGFIMDLDSDESIFVHINNIQEEDLNEGDRVLFETEKGPKGLSAINVKLGKKPPKPKPVVEEEKPEKPETPEANEEDSDSAAE